MDNINEVNAIVEVIDGKEVGIMGIFMEGVIFPAVYGGKNPEVFPYMMKAAQKGVDLHKEDGEDYKAVAVKFKVREFVKEIS